MMGMKLKNNSYTLLNLSYKKLEEKIMKKSIKSSLLLIVMAVRSLLIIQKILQKVK